MLKFLIKFLFLSFLVYFCNTLAAEDTHIDVRVLSKDAKFIGNKTGTMKVNIIDIETNKTLASGNIEGGTGDTKTIMKTPKTRNSGIATAGAAKYSATLKLNKARKVRIEAIGPLDLGERSLTASTEIWLLPGKHMTHQDGVVLLLTGFLINAESEVIKGNLKVAATVTMLCGCPIEPEGLWDANQYQITAELWKDEEKIRELPLNFLETSQFEGNFKKVDPGTYKLGISAYDPISLNTGYQEIDLKVSQ
ncbi:MAG: hypothetical protein HWE27_09615 [Gammaproteobacteria bacterium]|nr:hypothetical protein [Gammaproteobacteria bacterium]